MFPRDWMKNKDYQWDTGRRKEGKKEGKKERKDINKEQNTLKRIFYMKSSLNTIFSRETFWLNCLCPHNWVHWPMEEAGPVIFFRAVVSFLPLKPVIALLKILQCCVWKTHFLPLLQFNLSNIVCSLGECTLYLPLVQMILKTPNMYYHLLQCLNEVLQGQIDFQDSTSQWVSNFIILIPAIPCPFITFGSPILFPVLELIFPVIRGCWTNSSLV